MPLDHATYSTGMPVVRSAHSAVACGLRSVGRVFGTIRLYGGVMDRQLTRAGILAGLIGATVVALWFLVVDAIAGRAFSTPIALGTSLLDTFSVLPGRGSATS